MIFNHYSLKDLVTIRYGKNQFKVVCEKSHFPIYGTGGLMGYATRPLYTKPSVLIGRKGTIGKVKFVDHPFWTVDTLFYTEVNEEIVIPKYLYYVMSMLDLNTYNEGTTIPSLRTETLYRLEFDIPSLADQQQLLSIIEPISKKISLNESINNNLEQQAFAMFDSLFPTVAIGNKSIGDYIVPKRGKNLLTKDAVWGTVPVVAGGLEPSTYHNISNTVAPVLTISASGANSGYVQLWNNPVWSSDSSYIDSSMTEHVYFWYVMLKKRQKQIYDSQTGSAQPHIYPQHIAVMPVIDLSETDIARFTEQVTPLFRMIGVNKAENNSLSRLRDILIPKLLSGQLDMSKLEF